MSTTILTSLSTYMSKTSSMTTSKLKFVILKHLNKWKIQKIFRGGSCPGGKCTKVGGGRCYKNRGGRCHKNGGGKCPGGKCNTTIFCTISLKRPDFDEARRSCSKLQAYWISCNVCVLVCWTGEMGCILQLSKFKKGKSHQAESDTLSKSHIWEMPFFGFAAFSINFATKQLFFRGLWLYGARLCLSPVICYWPPFLLQSTLSGSPQSWKSKRKYVKILIPLFSES